MSTSTGAKFDTFRHGGTVARADFHLHTNADKEFNYSGQEDQYIGKYVQQVKESEIQLGVITNHNKFDAKEFRALRRKALKEEICLLPGIELSVNDGSNGIHALVVFSEAWLENGNDYINQFLNVTFAGKTPEQYERENGRTNDNVVKTITKLERYNRDFFIVFAHVEQDSGLWNELDGGRIGELGRDKLFRRRTLGFQKVKTHDVPDRVCRVKVQKWLNSWYPAELEGSDCKSIDDIGKGKSCYLKLGDFTFEAVKYALSDCENRVMEEPKSYKHSYVKSIHFEGGLLGGEAVHFSPELNTLIGIRGSGKSAILEAIRFVLDMPFGEKALDKKYKEDLVAYAFKSGGKATITAVDCYGREYEIRRILNEKPDVFEGGELQPGVKIRETVLRKPIYFGQKDLASTGEGFEKDLVEKLVGDKLVEVRHRIAEQQQSVSEAVDRLQKLINIDDEIKEFESKKQDAEFQLKVFSQHGVEEKLQKEVEFDDDAQHIKNLCARVKQYLTNFTSFIDEHKELLHTQKSYASKQNPEFFSDFYAIYDKLLTAFHTQEQSLESGRQAHAELEAKVKSFEETKNNLKEEFAEMKRKLSEELETSGAHSVRLDDFLKLRNTIDKADQKLVSLKKDQAQRATLKNKLIQELTALDRLWLEEFEITQTELDKINQNQPSLRITSHHKGDTEAFVSFMIQSFSGSGLRQATLRTLAEEFADFGAMYRNFDTAKERTGGYQETFAQYFTEKNNELLIWRPPDRFVIQYHGKELKHHSLGERASALILFVLSQSENDVIIIDQPEDDLDSKTIYEEVIKKIRQMKSQTQFIFATHNANVPVLGDAEHVHSCRLSDEKVELYSGSIDNPKVQKEIVDIMEGGDEAFNRRKDIYQIWKP